MESCLPKGCWRVNRKDFDYHGATPFDSLIISATADKLNMLTSLLGLDKNPMRVGRELCLSAFIL